VDIMEEKIFEFTRWIYENFGRLGLGLVLLLIIAVLVLAFVLLNKLPEPKAEGDIRME